MTAPDGTIQAWISDSVRTCSAWQEAPQQRACPAAVMFPIAGRSDWYTCSSFATHQPQWLLHSKQARRLPPALMPELPAHSALPTRTVRSPPPLRRFPVSSSAPLRSLPCDVLEAFRTRTNSLSFNAEPLSFHTDHSLLYKTPTRFILYRQLTPMREKRR